MDTVDLITEEPSNSLNIRITDPIDCSMPIMERATLKGGSAETVMRTDPSSAISVVAVTPLGPVYNKPWLSFGWKLRNNRPLTIRTFDMTPHFQIFIFFYLKIKIYQLFIQVFF